MTNLLCIESSTSICSVALANEGQLMGLEETEDKNAHSARLTVLIEKLLKDNNLKMSQLDAVAMSRGPGSYTGLRIGASVAKGLCYGLNIPLIAVSTLQAMALQAARILQISPQEDVVFIPMIDARRVEVYSAVYNFRGEELREVRAEIITADLFEDIHSRIVICGDGAAKCRQLFENDLRFIIMERLLASAAWLVPLAWENFVKGKFENTAYFEPYYLKDFIAGIPHIKGLK
jgi:tRNA threonylcarbamoyladenosine biosynthesis protein TsaB